jgi:transposase-like protein
MKQRRTFSEAFKREKVYLIEKGEIKVCEVVKLYEVTKSSVYSWIRTYGIHKSESIVIQKKSEATRNIELLKKIALLEQVIGQMQVDKLFLESVIACGSDLMGEDLKKKYYSKQLKKSSKK